MAPLFAKGDRVRAYATIFDKKEEDLDPGEQLFSDKWAADGMGFGVTGQWRVCMSKKGERRRST
jgi:hypothetical protein